MRRATVSKSEVERSIENSSRITRSSPHPRHSKKSKCRILYLTRMFLLMALLYPLSVIFRLAVFPNGSSHGDLQTVNSHNRREKIRERMRRNKGEKTQEPPHDHNAERAETKAEAIRRERETKREKKIKEMQEPPYDHKAKRAEAIRKKRSVSDNKISRATGFIILGMHRSGTSMLAGILATGLGYDVGNNLMEATRENEKGFFERWDVVNQNTEFFRNQKMEWNWNVISYDDAKAHKIENFKAGDKSLDFFNNETDVPWIQKDPRMCITLKTWLEYITHQPAVLFTYRHPMEVVRSLMKRTERVPHRRKRRPKDRRKIRRRRLTEQITHPVDEENNNFHGDLRRNPRPKFSKSLGFWLWIVYNMRAIENSVGLCRVLTSNEKILADPFNEVKRISHELSTNCGLSPPPIELTKQDIDDFIDPTLQKQRLKSEENDSAEGETDLSHGCEKESEFIGTDIEKNLYSRAMKIYCDLRNGDAFKVGYEWYETELKDLLTKIPHPPENTRERAHERYGEYLANRENRQRHLEKPHNAEEFGSHDKHPEFASPLARAKEQSNLRMNQEKAAERLRLKTYLREEHITNR